MKKFEFLGMQENFPHHLPPIALFNLLVDLPGHPAGSTVSKTTLVSEGLWEEENVFVSKTALL